MVTRHKACGLSSRITGAYNFMETLDTFGQPKGTLKQKQMPAGKKRKEKKEKVC